MGGKSDGKPEPLPAPDDLGATPQELSAAQVALVDVSSAVERAFPMWGSHGVSRSLGATSEFDNQELNHMLEMVEGTKPAHLEDAGQALWGASKAISDAAEELRKNIKTAGDDWHGEAGKAFEKWGGKLADTTDSFATFVELAGVQVTAAAGGLSSVKSSLPPRDTRPVAERKRPEQLTQQKLDPSDPKYTEAVKVEKNRQEAINQMYRLASFYSVSGKGLEELHGKAPTFEAMPNVGVPQPTTRGDQYVDGGGGQGTGSGSGHQSISGGHTTPAGSVPSAHGTPPDVKEIHGSISMPDRPVGTEIDSVGTLPDPTVHSPVQPSPSVPNSTGTPNQPAPFAPGLPTTSTGRSLPTGYRGGQGTKSPLAGQGRTSATGGSTGSNRGTTSNPMGRGTSTGQGGAKGASPAGRTSSTARGISGGTGRSTNNPMGRAGGPGRTGASGRDGVVGGRPGTSPTAAGKGGQRGSRGTVIGAEGQGKGGAAGRVGQRGVVGAQGSGGANKPKTAAGGRQVQGSGKPVTGKPAGKTSGRGNGGFSKGGAGLVRGPQNARRPGEREEDEGTERPDWLVEDEQTHLSNKPRRDVPPVID
jgi:uncharacterized protein YukE